MDATKTDDDLYAEAVSIVRKHQKASISLVQRHLNISYNKAAMLFDLMEERGVVSRMQSYGIRTVLS